MSTALRLKCDKNETKINAKQWTARVIWRAIGIMTEIWSEITKMQMEMKWSFLSSHVCCEEYVSSSANNILNIFLNKFTIPLKWSKEKSKNDSQKQRKGKLIENSSK